jgi:uncharacterized membrane protein
MTMSKTMIATALAALMLSATGASAAAASAATKHKHHVAVGSKAAQAYARDAGSAANTLSTRDDWDNRSLFYRGPTYIGRY